MKRVLKKVFKWTIGAEFIVHFFAGAAYLTSLAPKSEFAISSYWEALRYGTNISIGLVCLIIAIFALLTVFEWAFVNND